MSDRVASLRYNARLQTKRKWSVESVDDEHGEYFV